MPTQPYNPGLIAQGALAQGGANVRAVQPANASYNTADHTAPTANNPFLGVKAKTPTPTPTPTTLPKGQAQPLYKGTLAANQVNIGTAQNPNIKTNAPSSTGGTTTSTTAPNTTVDTSTQQQNEQKYNNQNPNFTSSVGGLAG